MNWNAVVAMLLLIGLATWLVVGPDGDELELRPGADAVELRIGTTRGRLERLPAEDSYRVLLPEADAPRIMTRAEVEQTFGAATIADLFEQPTNWLFKLFNITSWASMAWIAVGLVGQIAFFLRMFVQWIASERQRDSVVPEAFWWLSLGGGIALFSYFVWRRDLIGVLGQTTGVVVYARNLRLIHKRRRRAATVGLA